MSRLEEEEEDEVEEADELLDQSFILRLPETVAKKLHLKLKQLQKTSRNYEHRSKSSKSERKKFTTLQKRVQRAINEYIKIEPAVDPTTNEELGDERYHFYIDRKCYPAKLFNLPCITETYASADKLGPVRDGDPKKSGDLTKSGDIGEILVVHDRPRDDDNDQMDWSWTEDPKLVYTKLEASRTQRDAVHNMLREGLTRPTKNVYTQRWAGEEFTNGWYPLKKHDDGGRPMGDGMGVGFGGSSVNNNNNNSGHNDADGGGSGDGNSSTSSAMPKSASTIPPLTRTEIEDMCRILTDNYEEAVEYTPELQELAWNKDNTVRVYDTAKVNRKEASDDEAEDAADLEEERRQLLRHKREEEAKAQAAKKVNAKRKTTGGGKKKNGKTAESGQTAKSRGDKGGNDTEAKDDGVEEQEDEEDEDDDDEDDEDDGVAGLGQ